jgi:hypothetical protein
MAVASGIISLNINLPQIPHMPNFCIFLP